MRPRAREGRAYGEGKGVCCQDIAKALFLVPCPSVFYLPAHTGEYWRRSKEAALAHSLSCIAASHPFCHPLAPWLRALQLVFAGLEARASIFCPSL